MPGDQRLGAERLGCRLIGPAEDPGELRPVGQRDIDRGAELVVVDDDARALPGHHVGQRRTGERGVEQQHVGADAFACGQCLDEAAMVAAHDAHHPRCPAGELLQGRGERVGPVVEFAVAQHAQLVDDGRPVRAPLRRHRDPDGVREAGARDGHPHPQVLVRP